MGPRAVLDRCGKSRPHKNSIPGPSSSKRFSIPITLSRSTKLEVYNTNIKYAHKNSIINIHCLIICNYRRWNAKFKLKMQHRHFCRKFQPVTSARTPYPVHQVLTRKAVKELICVILWWTLCVLCTYFTYVLLGTFYTIFVMISHK